ncbi:hypothetical protein DLAC_00049 [Tieghemostelium lacteum]|uniref:Uncharacterized protein n=1 Tax=Tieghemostelium lacteum TaxID=361077 RepID=A0A152A8S5_TIELA|nr:hypothetical protein DLAC_00049 [Tieghemostelium lacteum]|eukprot:KYR02604.1 hypothetical protein DLAC_00049 [Tieghemostelium lacteum]
MAFWDDKISIGSWGVFFKFRSTYPDHANEELGAYIDGDGYFQLALPGDKRIGDFVNNYCYCTISIGPGKFAMAQPEYGKQAWNFVAKTKFKYQRVEDYACQKPIHYDRGNNLLRVFPSTQSGPLELLILDDGYILSEALGLFLCLIRSSNQTHLGLGSYASERVKLVDIITNRSNIETGYNQ